MGEGVDITHNRTIRKEMTNNVGQIVALFERRYLQIYTGTLRLETGRY